MKLIRFGNTGNEKPGVLTKEGKRLDVSAFGMDYDESFFGSNGVEKLRSWLNENASDCPVVGESVRWASPTCRPSKIICIGLNYAKHAAEGGMDIPKEPVIFFKATSAICGPFDDVIIPRGSDKLDWEVELAFVISKKASYVSEDDAMDHVAGYVLHNDISERTFQLERSGQWVKGKSADTFAPLGPFVATSDEISDPDNLNLWLKVNGQSLQSSNTSDMVFNIAQLLSSVSQYMTLLPGDIISTGTPEGVGLGFKPPRYLSSGDTMELGIEGLGVSKQTVRNI